MKLTAHLTLQRRIDQLVLADTRQTGKGAGNDACTVVVTVSCQIVDDDLGIRKGFGQMGMQRFDGHGHR